MKRPFVGVVADDITGAGDIGGLFARHGYAVHVFAAETDLDALPGRLRQGRVDVVVLDTDSRFDAPQAARRKVAAATRALQRAGCEVYWKKTCSVFRGNVGVEFDTLLETLGGTFGVAVAAFPRNGRTTEGGIHRVHGRLLAQSEFAADPIHPRRQSDLVADLAGQTPGEVAGLPLATVRRGAEAVRAAVEEARRQGLRYLLADAVTQHDLHQLAQALADHPIQLGSSALAEELARVWPAPPAFDPFAGVSIPAGGVLVVAGSVTPQTQAQVQTVEAAGAPLFTLTGRQVLDGTWPALAPIARGHLDAGETVVLRLENWPAAVEETRALAATHGLSALQTSQRLSATLAALAADVLHGSACRRVIVLGGDTSAAVCRALHVEHTVVLEEIAPGLPASLVVGERPMLLVLKSGSFGGADFVAQARHTLQTLGAAYRNRGLGWDERVADLVARMTFAEKVSQLQNSAPAVERLGIPRHNYWNECLHGVARAGLATVFPQAIGLAATWDPDLLFRIATAISDEARAKHHQAVREGRRDIYTGLTFWSPNVNILRDPRWGRAQETYGEDPWLTSRMAVAFIRGLQGDDPDYLKLVATAKHFAAHSGPEGERHRMDVRATDEDLEETYLPAFEAAVQEARVESIMTAYTRLNGEACSSHRGLLEDVLRRRWGFDGYVVSDCGAIDDIFKGHGLAPGPAAAATRALQAGCDLECGAIYAHLPPSVEPDVDRALHRVLKARFRLGLFERTPFDDIPWATVDSDEHRTLALEAARKSIVLLENDGLLPLSPGTKVAVVGPHADSLDVLLGNYHGTPSRYVTFRQGLTPVPEAEADVVVACLGLSPRLEGEEGDVDAGTGDRTTLALPASQEALLARIGKPTVLVLTGGSALTWNARPNAVLMSWYPGEEGGTALADILYGRINPSGRLPCTFYRTVHDLPPFEDYRMAGRTYRYMTCPPRYPFGHGLSYSRFDTTASLQGREVVATVHNAGPMDGEEVVQVYVRPPRGPRQTLVAFRRVTIKAGESVVLRLPLHERHFRRPGRYEVVVEDSAIGVVTV